MLGKAKVYTFLVDKLTLENGEVLRRAIMSVEAVQDAQIKVKAGVVEVRAKKDIEEEFKIACSVAKCTFRSRVSGSSASYYS